MLWIPIVIALSFLVGAAESTQIKNNVGNTVTLNDATGTPVTLVLAYDDGDLTGDGISQVLNEYKKITRRGKFVCVVNAERVFPKISFSTWVGNMVGSSSSAPGTPLEFATGKGAYSANVSTLGTGRRMAVDVKYTCEGTNFGDASDETYTWEDVILTGKWAEGYEGQKIEWSGECHGPLIFANSTNTVTIAQAA
jgi:hypothetical protein